MYLTVIGIFHILIGINCNQISEGLLYIPLEHWWTCTGLHGVTSQKVVLFMFTVMRTSNQTSMHVLVISLFQFKKAEI
jgi:hypothetical protein